MSDEKPAEQNSFTNPFGGEEEFESELIYNLPSHWEYSGTGKELNRLYSRETTDILIKNLLVDCLKDLNPQIQADTEEWVSLVEDIEEYCSLTGVEGTDEVNERKETVHDWMMKRSGRFMIEDRQGDEHRVTVIDTENPENNTWTVSNQVRYTYDSDANKFHVYDIVAYVNGIPLIITEVKHTGTTYTIDDAMSNIRTYENEAPEFFVPSLVGTGVTDVDPVDDIPFYYRGYGASEEHENPWYNDEEGESYVDGSDAFASFHDTQVITEFLEYGEFFIQNKHGYSQVVARHHQFFGSKRIMEDTNQKLKRLEDNKEEVSKENKRELISHTQGSGKTYTMLFAANRIRHNVFHPKNSEPLRGMIIVDRDNLNNSFRNELDNSTSSLNIVWEEAKSKNHLVELLEDDAIDLVLTTIQKVGQIKKGDYIFEDAIYTLEDEVHREMLNKQGARLDNAFPNAIRYGLTGTPTEEIVNKFGCGTDLFLHEYSLKQGLDEGMVLPVKIMRTEPTNMLAKLEELDELFEQEMKHEEVSREQVSETIQRLGIHKFEENWAAFQKMVMDYVTTIFKKDYYKSNRNCMMVCGSRKLAAKYATLISDRIDDEDAVTAVYDVGQKDSKEMQIAKKYDKKEAEKRFKDPDDPLQMLVVCKMFLTGFDAPSLECMFLNKHMGKEHNLQQAIARVNRPRDGKNFGKIIDLKNATEGLEVRFQDKDFEVFDVDVDEAIDKYTNKLNECLKLANINSWEELFDLANNSKEFRTHIREVFSNEEKMKEFAESYRKAKMFREEAYPDSKVLDYESNYDALTVIYRYTNEKNTYKSNANAVGRAGGKALQDGVDLSEFTLSNECKIDEDLLADVDDDTEIYEKKKKLKEKTKNIERQLEIDFSSRIEDLFQNWISAECSNEDAKEQLDKIGDIVDSIEDDSTPEKALEIQSIVNNRTDKDIDEETAEMIYLEITKYNLQSNDADSIWRDLYQTEEFELKEYPEVLLECVNSTMNT